MSAFEEGEPTSKICFLAEAPGRVEIAKNRPLVGPSGMVWEQLIHAAGLTRAEAYLLNVFPFQVRKTAGGTIMTLDGNKLWTPKLGFTDLGEKETAETRKKLELCSANVICAVGGVALSLVTGVSEITKWRGSILRSEYGKVIGTIHPSATFMRGEEKEKESTKGYTSPFCIRYTIIEDMKRVKEQSAFPHVEPRNRDWQIEPTFEAAMLCLKQMNESPVVNFDVEVFWEKVDCISFARDHRVAMSIPFFTNEGPYWTPEQEADIRVVMQTLFSNPNVLKVNQNMLFDIAILTDLEGFELSGPFGDPMVAHRLMYPDLPASLAYLCSTLTEEPYYKDEGRVGKDVVDWRQRWRYNAKDSCVSLECFQNMQEDLDNDGYRETYETTCRLYPAFADMMNRGFKINLDRAPEVYREVEEEFLELERQLKEICGDDFNFASSKQCCEYFYGTKKIKAYLNKGRPSCDKNALSRLFRTHGLQEAQLVQRLRELGKQFPRKKGKREGKTFIEKAVDPDGRLRCSINPVMSTGRISTSQTIFGRGMNMQNINPAFLRLMEADNEEKVT